MPVTILLSTTHPVLTGAVSPSNFPYLFTLAANLLYLYRTHMARLFRGGPDNRQPEISMSGLTHQRGTHMGVIIDSRRLAMSMPFVPLSSSSTLSPLSYGVFF